MNLTFNSLKLFIKTNKELVAIVIITIFAFFLRFYHLGYNSFTGDEITTIRSVQGSFLDIWNIMYTHIRPTPPLFYFMEHFALLFGNSEFIVRFLPALFGSLTIPVVYLIGKEIINKAGGLIAALLFTVSVFHIWYSQDARAYALLLFVFLLAVLFYICGLKYGKKRYWILFGVFSALSFWCHFYILIGLGILLLHGLIICVYRYYKKEEKTFLKSLLISIGIFIIASLPIFLVGLNIIGHQLNPIQAGLTGFFTIPYNIFKLLTLHYLQITLIDCIIVGIYCLLFIFGIFYWFKKNHSYPLLVSMMVIIPPILSMVLSLIFGLAIWQQYLAFILPFIYLGISSMILLIPKHWNLTKVTILVLSLILILSSLYLPIYYTDYMKNDVRGASHYLYNITNDGDLVIDFTSNEFSYYYNQTLDNTELYRYYNSKHDLDLLKNSTNNVYLISTWDTEPKNISEIAPSGLELIDNLIEKYYATTTLDVGDSDVIAWMRNNTIVCSKYQYFGPYRTLYIRKLIPANDNFS